MKTANYRSLEFSVAKTFIAKASILLPPLAEQRAIAAYLDRETARIDALIARTQQLNALFAREASRAHQPGRHQGAGSRGPAERFGCQSGWATFRRHWDVKRMKHVTWDILKQRQRHHEVGRKSYQSSGVLFIRSQNVHFDGLRLTDVVFIVRGNTT